MTLDAVATGLLLLGMFAGAVTLRVTGIGFALVATPFLVLAVGPWQALGLIHLIGILACLVLTWRLWADIDWRRGRELFLWALVAVVPGTWLAYTIPERTLQLTIGVALLLALLVVVSLRELPRYDGRLVRALGGFSCGMFTFAAGMGGPALTVYSRLARWPQEHFVATLQPMFAALGVFGLLGRLVASGAAVPALPAWVWPAAVALLGVGLSAGDKVAEWISPSASRAAVLAVAFAGTLALIGQAL